MTHATSIRWLTISAYLLIGIGVIYSWTTTGPLASTSLLFVDLAILPLDGAQSYMAAETRLLAAIVGGLTAGFGVAVLLVTKHVYVHDPALGRRIMLGFVLTWFLVDSIGSVLSGAAFNAVINLVVLAMLLPPLLLAGKNATASPAT